MIWVNLPFTNRIHFEVHVDICSQLRRVLIIYGVKLQDHLHNGVDSTENFCLKCLNCITANLLYWDSGPGIAQTTVKIV